MAGPQKAEISSSPTLHFCFFPVSPHVTFLRFFMPTVEPDSSQTWGLCAQFQPPAERKCHLAIFIPNAWVRDLICSSWSGVSLDPVSWGRRNCLALLQTCLRGLPLNTEEAISRARLGPSLTSSYLRVVRGVHHHCETRSIQATDGMGPHLWL